jgi:hypothetical protein
MAQPSIQPEKITKPIQLVAAWFAALVLLVGSFLTAANSVDNPSWLPVVLAFGAVGMVPFFALLVFRLQTRYRPELQEDPYYSKYKAEQAQQRGFRPENVVGARNPDETHFGGVDETDLKDQRRSIYERNRGLFLVHTWRPSTVAGQVADITVRLHEHGDRERPLSEGNVSKVEYYLGQSFFGGNVISKTNADESFRLDVAAYGSTDCVARVHFNDGSPSVVLDRYLDFAT